MIQVTSSGKLQMKKKLTFLTLSQTAGTQFYLAFTKEFEQKVLKSCADTLQISVSTGGFSFKARQPYPVPAQITPCRESTTSTSTMHSTVEVKLSTRGAFISRLVQGNDVDVGQILE
jgi:hypothetical protein